MSVATWHTGDALEVLQTLPDESVDLVITSPPFLALRSYLPADHDHKHREMGSEATPGEFVDNLMLVVEECRRVLAPHGSIGLELGDTFAGSGGAGGDYNDNGFREGQAKFSGSAKKRRDAGLPDNDRPSRAGRSSGWPLPKSLSLIPETVRFTMVYGRNPHTGRETDPWRLRNVVRWCRPNPPVGALGDKYRPATTELMIFAKNSKRYFDLDVVRQPLTERAQQEVALGGITGGESYQGEASDGTGYNGDRTRRPSEGGGRPPYDYWVIPTQPYKGSHYATWPRKLLDIPLRSMVPQRVCRECGAPSERMTEPTAEYEAAKLPPDDPWRSGKAPQAVGQSSIKRGATTAEYETLGWTDCGHDQWRNGIVLDPFAGSGTTLEVATGMGLDAIGIDLDERNYDLALRRVGMFLEHA